MYVMQWSSGQKIVSGQESIQILMIEQISMYVHSIQFFILIFDEKVIHNEKMPENWMKF